MKSTRKPNRRIACAWGMVMIAMFAPTSHGASLIVDQGGGAFLTIQSAINAAVDGDEITVSPGVYTERIDFLGKAIRVRSTVPWDPNVVDNTVIDAEETGHAVTFANNETREALLDGFTIQNGSATHGGGIYCVANASPTIRRNLIESNFCVLHGSGIHCSDGASPLIVENDISDNFAEGRGSGIFCENSNARIERNRIAFNFAPGSSGGGISLGAGADGVIIVSNEIRENFAVFGGGLHVESSARIDGNRIIGNIAFPRAGGISVLSASPTIVNNIVAGNLANIAAALDANASAPLIQHNTFIGNQAVDAAILLFINGSEAELSANILAFNLGGAAVHAIGGSQISLDHNCLFDNEAGDTAGSVEVGDGNLFLDPRIKQLGEWVLNKDPGGGGGRPGDIDVVATLQGPDGAGGLADYRLRPDRERFRVDVFGFPPSSQHTIFLNGQVVTQLFVGAGGIGGLEFDTNDGNFPPAFPDVHRGDMINVGGIATGILVPEEFGGGQLPLIAWQQGDEHLMEDSPCVDAVMIVDPHALAPDIDGQPRTAGELADVGADEFVPPGTGDFDGDGDVDLVDVRAFQLCIGEFATSASAFCEPGDFDLVGGVDLTDHAALAGLLGGPM